MEDVGLGVGIEPATLRRLAEVRDAWRLGYVFLDFVDYRDASKIVPFFSPDPKVFSSFGGVIVDGERPDPSDPRQILVSPGMAQRRHLHPGSHVRVRMATADDLARIFQGGEPAAHGPLVTLTVSGVVHQPLDLVEDPADQDVEYLGGHETLYLGAAFARRLLVPTVGPDVLDEAGTMVWLVHGARDVPRFRADLRRITSGMPGGGDVQMTTQADSIGAARRAIRVQAVALWLFTLAAALAGLLLVGQALNRHLRGDAADHVVLSAIGMTSRQLVAASIIRAAVVVTAGALGGALVAVAASPLLPVGLAREAEVHPGVLVDLPVLAVGVAATVVVLVAWTLLPARRSAAATDGRSGARSRSSVFATVGGWTLPASASVGVAMAVDPGRGRSAVPVRSTLVTFALAVAAMTATFTFAASLDALASTPRTYGWNFDVAVGNPNLAGTGRDELAAVSRRYTTGLERDRHVGAFTGFTFVDVDVNGGRALAMGIDVSHGAVLPSLASGRQPETPTEVALTTSALRRTHAHLGEVVTVATRAGRLRATVVGTIVPPPDTLSETQGDVIEVPIAGLRHLQAGIAPTLFFVRYVPGADAAAAYRSLRHRFGPVVLQAIRPVDVENLVRISWMPWALAALLALLALGTLGHALVASIRRRRHVFAIFKTIGFVRRQVSTAVAFQATTFALIALVIGIPVGVAGGRLAWKVVSGGAGVLFRPVTPLTGLAVGVGALLLVANAIAALPGWVAGRLSPAPVLRTE